jgi:hypothetical protein
VACTATAGGAVLGVDPDGSAGPSALRSLALLKNVSCANALQPANFMFHNRTPSNARRSVAPAR